MNKDFPKIYLKAKKDEPVRRFHPWVFSGAIKRMEGGAVDGDTVEVYDHQGQFLATGHFHNGSIAVRIFAFEKTDGGLSFWKNKIEKARIYRQSLGLIKNPVTNCYRLIHAEGDGLPGLIVDVYHQTAVVQCHSIGMHLARHFITEAILSEMEGDVTSVYDKSKDALPSKYAAGITNSYLNGPSVPQPVLENSLSFSVDWEQGQKTGFFLDQRDNRQLLKKFVAGKTVLNAFSYSGGFSVYALSAGASLVHSVDVSQKAIQWCDENVKLNGFLNPVHKGIVADAQKFLNDCQKYDVMVVDPPAFAKSFSKRHNAVQGYKRLNEAALRKVTSGGVLFTFSCSQVVDRELFYNTIVAAAIEAGRRVRVMHHLSQPPDHPVSLFHPEGAYLKGLALYVE